ncbi:transcriptional regulator, TetR family [Actinacidiphila yanglinensis]|uniref:Transcriptional regulator, TetR family n=1 Tax=Actinacidiphila yanglinensis TaxID=310779 RepID=A0A1H5XA11_9ACTN|nr:TetR/AcrR family transcriptional regulator [Actinacidiphila yanglinensis]SEG08187.1 transcriptional regulator, TetR family [Actinacidiphila yanglinensis]
MTTHPYHHGRLRTALLTEAERILREDGAENLSLRELARRAGVSHGAPRHHFPDRQSLLDALAEAGFLRLGDEVRAAIGGAAPDFEARLRATATAYVRFAVRESALLDLMFARKSGGEPNALTESFMGLSTAVGDLIHQGQQVGRLPPVDPERLRLLLVATLQGIAALIIAGRAPVNQMDALITDAITLFAGDHSRQQTPGRVPKDSAGS